MSRSSFFWVLFFYFACAFSAFGLFCVDENGLRIASCSSSKNPGPPEVCGIGNPINPATGNKYQAETSYRGNSQLGIPDFNHVYNSQSADIDMGLGYGWTSRILRSLVNNGGHTIQVRNGTGKREIFRKINGVWQGDADTLLEITEDAAGIFTLNLPRGKTERYNNEGQLLEAWQSGIKTTYTYGAQGLLSSISGHGGQSIQLDYTDDERLSSMTDPALHVYRYGYDAQGNLVSVTYPDETVDDDTDNPVRRYHYENVNFPHHLTGITDENGNRYATWRYDSQGRANHSEHAGAVESNSLVFNTDDSTTVTSALGKETTYHFTEIHNAKRITQIEGHAAVDCPASSKAYTYDNNGFLSSKTDFNGNVTNYIHDSRGLETSRTEGAGTAVERTISTEWEPVLRLPVKITEPVVG